MDCPLKKIVFACLVLSALFASYGSPLYARKLVIVTANRLTLHNITSYSLTNISTMASEGAAGLISPNCAGNKIEESVLLTASSGCPMKSDQSIKDIRSAEEPFNTHTESGREYALRTGFQAGTRSGVVLNMAEIEHLNTRPMSRLNIGLIGDSYLIARKKIASLGNADSRSLDSPAYLDRSFAVLASDSRGIIERFDPAPNGYPTGVANLLTDPELMAESIKQANEESDLVIACFGDLVRLDDMRLRMSSHAYRKWKSEALGNLDKLTGILLDECRDNGAVLVIVSFGLPEFTTWDQLTPILVYGAGSGVLQSASTRTPGIMTAADFSPTVLNLANITPARRAVGRSASVVNASNSLEKLDHLNRKIQRNKKLLAPMGGVCAGLAATVLCIVALAIAFDFKTQPFVRRILRFGMLTAMSLPAAMMIAALSPPGILWYIIATAVCAILIALAAMLIADNRLHRIGSAAAIVYAVSAVIIIADAFSGTWLCRFALPSSYYLSGMRYYGTGNEYAAFATGMASCAILYLGSVLENRMHIVRWLTAVAGLVMLTALGWGMFGANYGATAALTTIFILLLISFYKGHFSTTEVIISFIIGMFVTILLSEIDAAIMGGMSTHAGRVAKVASYDGIESAMDMILRKLRFNFQIMLSTQAILVALAFVPFLYFWFNNIQGKVKQMIESNPQVKSGYAAVAVGSLAALILNDSGIVMAAIIIAVLLSAIILRLFESEDIKCRE